MPKDNNQQAVTMDICDKGKSFARRHSGSFVMTLLVLLHLIFILFLQIHVRNGGDGIFTYTLANNPYAYVFIDPEYKYLPESNGWINAHILRESYVVEDYDQFNYSAVYFHQRLDTHPLAYYFLVHTICSIFHGTYSSLWSMIINFIFVGAVDVLMIKFFKKMYGRKYYAVVAFVSLFFLLVMQQLYILARMYIMLGFCCLWYLYIHYELVMNIGGGWKRSQLVQLIACIILGSQTHYYFYVYAVPLTMFVMAYLFYKREIYKLLNYVYSGFIGIAVSWIIFPWVIWHIFFNQMQKHTIIYPWTVEKIKGYIEFLNQNLFNGRGCIAIVVIIALMIFSAIGIKNKKEENKQSSFLIMTFVNTVIFSLIIYTLDESVWYYSTPLYLSFVLLFSVEIVNLVTRSIKYRDKEWLIILLSVVCVTVILSLSSTLTFVSGYLEESEVDAAYRKTASEYKGYDCIFVEKEQNNLFSDNFLVLGDYDEFKKISVEEFNQNGIQEKDLLGRQSNNGLVIYIPVECEVPEEQKYLFLSSNGNYKVYMVE